MPFVSLGIYAIAITLPFALGFFTMYLTGHPPWPHSALVGVACLAAIGLGLWARRSYLKRKYPLLRNFPQARDEGWKRYWS